MPRSAFSLVVLATLVLFAFFGAVILQPEWFAGLLGQAAAGHVIGHFREPHHRMHDLTFAFLLGTAAIGIIAQVRAPAKNGAGQLMALVPFASLVLVTLLTTTQVLQLPWVAVGAATLLAATLHPSGRDLFGSFAASRVDRAMLALVGLAAVPLLAFAFTNIGLERSAGDDHAALGHYGFLAAFSLTVIGTGLLASARTEGWRLTARVTGLLTVLFGLASLAFPDVASSLDLVWAMAAVAWGVLFIAAAEVRRTTSVQKAVPRRGYSSTSPRAVITALLLIVLVALFAFMHLTGGGGPGLHAPPTGGQWLPARSL